MFTPLHRSTNQEPFKNMPVIKVATMRKYDGTVCPSSLPETEVSITLLCQLFSTRYTAVQIKNSLKSTSAIKVETIRTISVTQSKPSRATTKLILFTVSKGEWNTKEDTGKSLKNALDVLWYAKRHLLG